MTPRPSPLNARFVREVTAPGRYGDGRGGHGLSLLVKPAAGGRVSKTWSQRLRYGSKIVTLGLGSFPAVTLVEARRRAVANHRSVEEGRHPRSRDTPTFAEAAVKVIEQRRSMWRDADTTARSWESSLRRGVFAAFGDTPITEVTRRDIYAALEGPWIARPKAARTLAGRIDTVMAWAVGAGWRDDNPTAAAISGLPKRRNDTVHHPHLHHAEVAGAIAEVRRYPRQLVGVAYELVALTACRSGEARGAPWAEFDLDEAIWTIPADRYKTGREHRMPLSERAQAVLGEARALNGESELVLPSDRGGPLPANALTRVVAEAGLGTVHGLRSSFRGWCAETGVAHEVAEAALGHVVRGVAASYQRSDLLEARRDVMERWSHYLAK